MNLEDFQREANRTDQRPGSGEGALLFPVIGLSSEVGSLVRHVKKYLRDGDAHELFSTQMAEELGDILWYVANLAEKLELSLDDLAEANLAKVGGRWPQDGENLPLPVGDEDFPEGERLPRRVDVRFEESIENGQPIVRLFGPDGAQLGHDLTDNAYEGDGYRYHDVFHLSFAAMLGWSPLTRKFFGVKRTSDPKVREVEDGGRATVIEEAISALIFDYGRDERFLDGVDHVDSSLLQAIVKFVGRLEVRSRSTHEWERAILQGFAVWRELNAAHGGAVRLDLINRTIEFVPPA